MNNFDGNQEPSGGLNIQVVAPGSGDDPFSSANPANPSGPDPAQTPASSAPTPLFQVPGSQPGTNGAPASPSQPAPAPSATANGLTREEFDERLRAAQSGWDKRIAQLTNTNQSLQSKLEAAEAEAIRREREALARNLSPSEVESMRQAWAAEDRIRDLDKKERAVTDLFKNVEGLRLLNLYSPHGVTEEDLLGYTGDPTSMEDWVKALAFERIQLGGNPGKPAATPSSGPASKPAGSGAPQDIGSTPSAASSEPQVLTTTGLSSMAANVKSLFA